MVLIWTWEKAKYSINKGLWGTSVGGDETLTSHLALPESAYPSQLESETPENRKLSLYKRGIDGTQWSIENPELNIQLRTKSPQNMRLEEIFTLGIPL